MLPHEHADAQLKGQVQGSGGERSLQIEPLRGGRPKIMQTPNLRRGGGLTPCAGGPTFYTAVTAPPFLSRESYFDGCPPRLGNKYQN